MAHEFDELLNEDCQIEKSSGGVFEVYDQDEKLFSKKELKRFPKGSEIFEIIKLVEEGLTLEDAKVKARENIPDPPTFIEWLQSFFKKQTT